MRYRSNSFHQDLGTDPSRHLFRIVEVKCGSPFPFRCRVVGNPGAVGDFSFFIPADRVAAFCDKPEKKQYRAYTISEWYVKFHLGSGMILRPKNHKSLEFHVVYNGYVVDTGSNEIKLYLGCGLYTLPELFQSYERLENGRRVPFGVEE